MGGGNSHQRAVQRAQKVRINKQVTETVAEILGNSDNLQAVIPNIGKKPANKWLNFIEQPLFLWAAGLLGGVLGLFIFTPILIVFGGCVLLAFHRAGVVHGKRLWVQIVSYAAIMCLIMA